MWEASVSNKGKLIVISGFSGSGKGTIVNELINETNNCVLSISATTRNIRANEKDGVNYFFISKEKFENMIKNNEFLEYAKYIDNYYGTPRKYVEEQLEKGNNVLLEIEMQGALKIKKMYSDAKLFFITTKDAKTLYERLKNRGRENDTQIEERLKQTITDETFVDKYDYIIVNDNLKTSINTIKNIINNNLETFDNTKNKEVINKLIKDIKEKNYV